MLRMADYPLEVLVREKLIYLRGVDVFICRCGAAPDIPDLSRLLDGVNAKPAPVQVWRWGSEWIPETELQ